MFKKVSFFLKISILLFLYIFFYPTAGEMNLFPYGITSFKNIVKKEKKNIFCLNLSNFENKTQQKIFIFYTIFYLLFTKSPMIDHDAPSIWASHLYKFFIILLLTPR